MTPFTKITLNYAVAITVNTQNEATLDPATIGMSLRSAIKANRHSLTHGNDHAVVDVFRIDYTGRSTILPGQALTPDQMASMAQMASMTHAPVPDHELDAEQLAARYGALANHPSFSRDDWISYIVQGRTLDGYWVWVLEQLRAQHKAAVEREQQTHTHVFDMRVAAPLGLDRDDVHDLLILFSDAAMQQLHATQDDAGADEEDREQASAALNLNIEILP